MTPLFVAAGHHGRILTSTDGRAWLDASTGKEGETYRTMAFGGGRLVTTGIYGGSNIYATSSDGAAWERGVKDAQYRSYIRGLGFDGQQFIGIGGDAVTVGGGTFVVTSPDGKTWGDYTNSTGKSVIRRLAFGHGKMVGVGDRGRRATSIDGGKTWTDAPDAKAVDTLVDITFGNGVFVGVGLHGLRMTSADGMTWGESLRGQEGEHINTVLWTGQQFVAIGAGVTFFSPDGRAWKSAPNRGAPLTACHGAGVFVGVHWKGRILFSKDALAWEQVHKADVHLETTGFSGSA